MTVMLELALVESGAESLPFLLLPSESLSFLIKTSHGSCRQGCGQGNVVE